MSSRWKWSMSSQGFPLRVVLFGNVTESLALSQGAGYLSRGRVALGKMVKSPEGRPGYKLL